MLTEPKPRLKFDSKLESSRLLSGEQGDRSCPSLDETMGRAHQEHTQDTPLLPHLLRPTLPGGSTEYLESPRSTVREGPSVSFSQGGGGGGAMLLTCWGTKGTFQEFLQLRTLAGVLGGWEVFLVVVRWRLGGVEVNWNEVVLEQ